MVTWSAAKRPNRGQTTLRELLRSTILAPWRSSIKSSGYRARSYAIGAASDQQFDGARQNLVGAVDRTILNGSSSLIVT